MKLASPPDAAAVGSLLLGLASLPERLTAVERVTAQMMTKLERLESALPPTLVPVSEAAEAFKVAVPTMRRWVKLGKVPTVKVGNTIRVDMSRLRGIDDQEVARLASAARDHRPQQPLHLLAAKK